MNMNDFKEHILVLPAPFDSSGHDDKSCRLWVTNRRERTSYSLPVMISPSSSLLLLSAPSPRVLKVFLSRTAQRTPYMTSWRVLRLLAVILLVVLWFLVAWTSAVCQSPELSQALISAGLTPEGLQFSMCLLDRWDYMMAVGKCVFFSFFCTYVCLMWNDIFTGQVRKCGSQFTVRSFWA